jgi:hypothetical protein
MPYMLQEPPAPKRSSPALRRCQARSAAALSSSSARYSPARLEALALAPLLVLLMLSVAAAAGACGECGTTGEDTAAAQQQGRASSSVISGSSIAVGEGKQKC